MKKLLENQHEIRVEQGSTVLENAALAKAVEREIEKGQRAPSSKWRGFYLAAIGMTILGACYSAFTEVVAFSDLLTIPGAPGGVLIAVIVACLLGLLIETTKRTANDAFFFGWVFRRRTEKAALVKLLLVSVISVSASFYACVVLPRLAAEASPTPPPVDVGTIEADFAGRIAKINEAIALYSFKKKSTYMRDAQNDLENAIAARDSTLSAARMENAAAAASAAAAAERQGWTIGYIGIGFELLYLLSFFYQKLYLRSAAFELGILDPNDHANDDHANDDRSNDDRSNDERRTPPPIDDKPEDKQPGPRTVVMGFRRGPAETEPNIEPKPEPTPEPIPEVQPKSGQKECPQCGGLFTGKHWNKTYCSDKCRGEAWEARTGAKLKKGKK